MQGHTGGVFTLAFAAYDQQLISGSFDQTIRVWDLQTGESVKVLRGHTGGIWSVAVCLDNQLLASGSGDQTIRLWNLQTGSCLNVLHEHTSWVTSVSFSPDGQFLISGSDDRTLNPLLSVSAENNLGWLYHKTFTKNLYFSHSVRK